jgi:hypothetical protein
MSSDSEQDIKTKKSKKNGKKEQKEQKDYSIKPATGTPQNDTSNWPLLLKVTIAQLSLSKLVFNRITIN